MHRSTIMLLDQANIFSIATRLVANELLFDGKFDIWSGSSKPEQHHYGKHGLTIHTHEVMSIAFNTKRTLDLDIDPVELYLSVLFHDSGKLYDYTTEDNINWTSAPHKRLIHHITRSALIWHDAAQESPEIYEKYHDVVLHNILAHHGQRDYGSPVAPKTRTAWLLHLSDAMSARMNDCDKQDLVKVK